MSRDESVNAAVVKIDSLLKRKLVTLEPLELFLLQSILAIVYIDGDTAGFRKALDISIEESQPN